MKRATTIVLALALVGGMAWWLSDDESGTPERKPEAAVGSSDQRLNSEDSATRGDEPAELQSARQRVADAKLAVQTAITQREAAAADLKTAEREVESLERWVADIEARGEDPVDYADEGLARLQPAFFAYQDAFERYELAEAMEAEATEDLAAAEAKLSKTLSSSGGEK